MHILSHLIRKKLVCTVVILIIGPLEINLLFIINWQFAQYL